jgi:hypothetical protein
VGENDAREFIARLNQMYLKKRSDPERRTFLGLISIGHSFGAQVLGCTALNRSKLPAR